MSRFYKILKNRNFFLLWLAQLISQVGDRLGQVALIGFVSMRFGNSPVEIAKILAFTMIPVFIVGPIAGVYVDRWDRRRTMYLSDFSRAILVVLIPLFLFYAKSLFLIYLIVFLVFCIARFFVPAKLVILSDLVEKDDLLLANSLVNITGMLAAIVGFGISGIIVEKCNPRNGLYLDSLSFLVSAILIFFITRKPGLRLGIREMGREVMEMIKKSVLLEFKEGVLYFFKHKEIRFAAVLMFILSAALGSVSVVLITFVQKIFNSVTKDLGLLSSFLGLGLFFGSLIYGRFGNRISYYKVILVSFVLSGIILVAFSLSMQKSPNFVLAAALALVLGASISPVFIAINTIIQKVSENSMMGKMFSSLEVVMHLGFLMFMFISSFLVKYFPHGLILTSAGIVFILLGAVSFVFHRKILWLDS
ncbi:MAG: MFS transporter [Candidatus Omnitrophota bacterium]|nr:MFS transporter [Candidatus Omnitrophota bacterium]